MINTDTEIQLNNIYCPSCGNPIKVINIFGEGYHYYCMCTACELTQRLTYDCARKAVEAWNRGEI